MERNVFDAVPPSFIGRSLYDNSGTSAGRTDLIE